jgi:hypothetical protein
MDRLLCQWWNKLKRMKAESLSMERMLAVALNSSSMSRKHLVFAQYLVFFLSSLFFSSHLALFNWQERSDLMVYLLLPGTPRPPHLYQHHLPILSATR